MNHAEVSHLIFRWLHVLSAIMWIGQIWSLVVVLRMAPDAPASPATSRLLLRAHQWLRASAVVTWLTGMVLLIIVYYVGGALTTPGQSLRAGIIAGLVAIFGGWLAYDVLWRVAGSRPFMATAGSLVLLGGVGLVIGQYMTGRGMFIHIGAMLATIMNNNVQQRIWPVAGQLAKGTAAEPRRIEAAAQRLRHNAGLAVAVAFFMISNHFPLLYGNSTAWLVAPALVGLIWLTSRLVASMAPRQAPQVV